MRILVNGFPKCGTHLAAQMVSAIAEPRQPDPWLCSFEDYSWTGHWSKIEPLLHNILSWPEYAYRETADLRIQWPQTGSKRHIYMLGHVGYREIIAATLKRMDVRMIFVIRDLRDVAVSVLRHIESDNPRLRHPDKAAYMRLGSSEERLIAVIEGLDHYPGIVERWKLYEGWLFVGGSQLTIVRYEEMVERPERTCQRIVNELRLCVTRDELRKMVYQLGVRSGPTFMNGIVGSWQEQWTPRVEDAWEKAVGSFQLRVDGGAINHQLPTINHVR